MGRAMWKAKLELFHQYTSAISHAATYYFTNLKIIKFILIIFMSQLYHLLNYFWYNFIVFPIQKASDNFFEILFWFCFVLCLYITEPRCLTAWGLYKAQDLLNTHFVTSCLWSGNIFVLSPLFFLPLLPAI